MNESCKMQSIPCTCHTVPTVTMSQVSCETWQRCESQNQKTNPRKHTNIKHKQCLSISQPLEVYCPTSKHIPITTPIHTSPFPRLRVVTPLSDVAVAVAGPVAVAVAGVLAPVTVLEANPELVLVAVFVSVSAPVDPDGPTVEVSDVARELEATVVVVAAVLFSMSTMDRTQLAASSVNF